MADSDDIAKIHNYPGKKMRSRVWVHFGFRKNEEGPVSKKTLDMSRAICRLCNKGYAFNGNTTTLLFHLDHEHKDFTTPGVTESKTSKPKEQKTLTQQWSIKAPPRPIVQSKKAKIDERLSNLVIKKLLPFSLVEDESFRSFVHELEERYEPPGRKALLSQIKKKYITVKGNIEEDLKHVSSAAITHDAWTSINTQSYDTVTADDWSLRCAVLRTELFPGSHTGQNIADNLDATVKLWKLPPVIAVTDNAANEQKAFELLGWPRVGCYGHRLNLIVKSGLAIPELAKLIAKGRSVVSYFHQSPLATGILEQKQKLLLSESAQGHKLIQDVSTRWNSTFDMLARLAEQTPALHAAVMDQSIPTLVKKSSELEAKLYSFEEQAVLDSVKNILQPFKTATEMLSAEKTPTQHLVLPIIRKLEMVLQSNDDDPTTILKLKTQMMKQLENRTSDRDIGLLACVLNPSTKFLHFVSEDERSHAKQLLMNEISEIKLKPFCIKTEPAQEQPQLPQMPQLPEMDREIFVSENDIEVISESDIDAPQPPPEKKPKLEEPVSCEDEWLQDIICCGTTVSTLSPEDLCQQEVDRYMALDPSTTAPLVWWKENEFAFPRIAKVAKKYLAVPASSVSSERIFSLAGNLVHKKRSQLKPENVDVMIFLHKNMAMYSD